MSTLNPLTSVILIRNVFYPLLGLFSTTVTQVTPTLLKNGVTPVRHDAASKDTLWKLPHKVPRFVNERSFSDPRLGDSLGSGCRVELEVS